MIFKNFNFIWKFSKLLFNYLILGQILSGCVNFGNKEPISNWAEIRNVDDVTCQKWPQTADVLRYENLLFMDVKNRALLAAGITRDGRKVQKYINVTKGFAFESAKLMTLNWGSRFQFLGSGKLFSNDVVYLKTGTKKTGPILQIRDLTKNTVLQSAKLGSKDIAEGRVYPKSDGAWLIYKEEQKDIALEDANSKVILAMLDGSKLKIKKFNGFSARGDPVVLPINMKRALTIWLDVGTSGRRSNPEFKVREVGVNGLMTRERVVRLPMSGQIESWSATAGDEGIFLAWIEGDSLLGDAVLRVAKLEWYQNQVNTKWIKEVRLENSHVAQPFWVGPSAKKWLILPKWSDHEITLGRLDVSASGIEVRKNMGVFDPGTAFESAFWVNDQRSPGIIMSYRAGMIRSWAVCTLDSIKLVK